MPALPGPTLTLRQMNRATLARQMLLDRADASPLEAIEHLIALQAQWPRPPFVGLWTRLARFDRAQLTTLFTGRKVVRAPFLRATLHAVTAKDFVAFRPAVQPALEGAMQAVLRTRLSTVDLRALTAQAHAILAESPQTFDELRERFLRQDPKADERAMAYCVRLLVPLVQVPEEGTAWAFSSRARFTAADVWLKRAIPVVPAAPDQLLMRYLAAYGPATAANFQAWAGLSPASVRDAISRAMPRLRRFAGPQRSELFDLPDAPRPEPDVPAPLRLIPEYDNLITTRADERFVAKSDRRRVFLSALRVAATVLVDGFVAGAWKLETTKKAALVTIEPFRPFGRAVQAAAVTEAERLARFAEPDAKAYDVKVLRA